MWFLGALVFAVVTLGGCGRVGFDAQGSVDAPVADIGDAAGAANLLTNGSFELSSNWPAGWFFQVNSPAAATLTRDTTTAHDGLASAHANVTAVDGTEFDVQLKQQGIAVAPGLTYTYTIWVRADGPHSTYLTAQLDHPPYTLFGMQPVGLTASWQMFSLVFSCPATDTALVSIMLGFDIGDYWVDDVRLTAM